MLAVELEGRKKSRAPLSVALVPVGGGGIRFAFGAPTR